MLSTTKWGVIFIAALLGASACTKKNQTAEQNVLRIPIKDDVKTLDPANAYDSVSLDIMPSILEPLLEYQYYNEQYVLQPLVADGMPVVSKDGKTVTVKIKKGVMFQDDQAFKETAGKGRELKAADFIYAYKRLALPAIQSTGYWIFDGKVVGFSEFNKKLTAAKKEDIAKVFEEDVEGMKVVDDYTFELKLTAPYPQLNYIFAMGFSCPVAREVVAAYADSDGNLRDHPVGTGPFMLKNWSTGQNVTLVRNPNYRTTATFPSDGSESFKKNGFLADAGKQLPMVDGIVFEILKEEQPRYLKFEKGELDVLEIPKDNFTTAMKDPNTISADLGKKGIQFSKEDSLIYYWVGFNVKDKVVANKYLRQAISSAIDRNKWIEINESGKGSVQTQLNPPGLADRAPNANKIKYDFDLNRAKELMKKAGYPNGEGLPELVFDFRGTNTKYRQLGEFFQQALGAIGVKIKVNLNTFPAYLEKSKQGNLQVFLGGWSMDYPDVENGYQLLYGANVAPGPNDSLYVNPQYDALYKKMAEMPSGSGRAAVVQKMEDIIQEDVPWAYGYYLKTYKVYQPWLKNYRVAEVIPNSYKYLRIERKQLAGAE